MSKHKKTTKPMIDQPSANLIGFIIVLLIVVGILGIIAKYDRHQQAESASDTPACQYTPAPQMTPAPVGELL